MGSMHALDYANGVADEVMTLETALHLHLRSNHYPPIPLDMVSVAVEAIDNANGGDFDAHVDLPDGITWKGLTSAPTSALVSDLHLDYFLAPQDDFDY